MRTSNTGPRTFSSVMTCDCCVGIAEAAGEWSGR